MRVLYPKAEDIKKLFNVDVDKLAHTQHPTGIEITEDNECLLRLFKEEDNIDESCAIKMFPKGLSAELLIHIFKVHGITSIDQDAIDQILASVKINL